MMKRSFHRPHRKTKLNGEMNVVPYIDVMLVLLIIFMVAAPMLTTGVDVSLPKEATSTIDTKDALPIIISMNRSGNLFVSHQDGLDEPMSLSQLMPFLQAAFAKNNQIQVLINADGQNSYNDIMQVMALVQNAGIDHVSLLSEPK